MPWGSFVRPRRKRDYLRTGEVAEQLRVTAETVRAWLESGKLRGTRAGENGQWRVPLDELVRFVRGQRRHG